MAKDPTPILNSRLDWIDKQQAESPPPVIRYPSRPHKNSNKKKLLRFAIYKEFLLRAKREGKTRIVSRHIEEGTGIYARQVRFDLLGLKTRGRSGYGIDTLLAFVNRVLNLAHTPGKMLDVIIVGDNPFAYAISQVWLAGTEFNLRYIFSDDTSISHWNSIPVIDINKMEEVLERENIELAFLCVKDNEKTVAAQLYALGIQGIINMTGMTIVPPENRHVEHFSPITSLRLLIARTHGWKYFQEDIEPPRFL